ncbi:MAG TPA: PLP-dependent aminotransferase family protein [Blastocatellia bacterium]|nr:PLP-dependent aminotransferase family protein [Blastocatellia bacterium]
MTASNPMPVRPANFSRRIDAAETSAVREILKVTEKPEIISFAGGLPAPEFFPKAQMAEAFSRAILENGEQALQYSTTEGYAPLRQWIATRMQAKGIRAEAKNILITSGSQQGLDLLAKVLLNSGDKILVERPTYLAALQTFSLFEANFITVASDDDGMDVDDAARKLRAHPDIKAIYLVANFQNPSGTTLSLERRQRLMALASQYGVRVFEDDPYGELRYRGEAIAPIKSLDEEGLVTYISTFSKTITPGLRVAWLVAEPKIYAKLSIAKQATDLHTNTVSQFAVHRYLTEHDADAHITKLRSVYGERCRVMLAALETHFPAGVRWTKPAGGMFLWVELPSHMNTAAMLPAAIQAKVAFVPGASFFANERPQNFMRLNFSNSTPERIAEGMRKLAEVIAQSEQQRRA